MSINAEQRRAWIVCGLVYVLATVAGGFTVWMTVDSLSACWSILLADVVGTGVVFAASVILNNSSLYDPYWSVAPMVIGLWLLIDAPELTEPRLLLGVALTLLWGGRLTWNFLRGWSSLEHEDWRYRDLRKSSGRAYWVVSFTGIHMFPTLLVFLGMLSVYVMAQPGTAAFGVLDGIGGLIALGAIWIEATADKQLREFRLSNSDPSRILDTGLWAWCRHPNYFGEMMFWWGLALMAISASVDSWWVVFGPLSITALFKFISLKLIDERMVRRRPHYAEHQKTVPALFPRPPRPTP
jgi:steroid 5-alpha reductase family enzyme